MHEIENFPPPFLRHLTPVVRSYEEVSVIEIGISRMYGGAGVMT